MPDVDAILSVVFSQRCVSDSLSPTSNLEPGTSNPELGTKLRTPNPEIQTSTLPTREFSNRIAKS